MSTNDPHLLLRDFVAWVRRRRPVQKDAWVDEKTLEFVAQGVEAFLDGKKPWPKRAGRKPEKDKMWECYYLTHFAEGDSPHIGLHKADNKEGKTEGVYSIIGMRLNISADAVEDHAANARNLVATEEGRIEFIQWVSKHKGGTCVHYYPTDHSEAIAERNRRESSGLTRLSDAPKRGRPAKGESDLK